MNKYKSSAKYRINRITSAIDKHKIISFDVFDTCLVRPYVKPSDVFKHLERLNNIPGFADARIRAEQNARKKKSTTEITFNEIYEEIDTVYKNMYIRELNFEKKITKANPEILAIFNHALKKKKKIIFISDMYLSREDIEELLYQNGYSGYHKLYVSSNCQATKYTGNLYGHVIRDINIPARYILHIGDNYYSDYSMARKCGLYAIHYPKPIDVIFYLDERKEKYYEENKDSLGVSIILGIMALEYLKHCNFDTSCYFEKFGYEYGGPAIYAYMQWLMSSLVKDGINEVFFIARDGYTLQKVFDLISKKSVPSHYVYAPRILSVLFLIDYNKEYFFDKIGLSGIKEIIKFYTDKNPYLFSHIPNLDTITFDSGKTFIIANMPIFSNLIQKEKIDYNTYIINLISEEKIAIVDTVSVWYSAQKLIKDIIGKNDIMVSGYYWFTNRSSDELIIRQFQQPEKPFINNWNIMEFIMTSPEPPLKSIENGNPVYQSFSLDEKKRSINYPNISRGAIRYAEDVRTIFGDENLYISCNDVNKWINIFSHFPNTLDKKNMKYIKHSDGFEHKIYTSIFPEWYEKKRPSIKKILKAVIFNNILPFRIISPNNEVKDYALYIPLLRIKRNNGVLIWYLFGFIPIRYICKKPQDRKTI